MLSRSSRPGAFEYMYRVPDPCVEGGARRGEGGAAQAARRRGGEGGGEGGGGGEKRILPHFCGWMEV